MDLRWTVAQWSERMSIYKMSEIFTQNWIQLLKFLRDFLQNRNQNQSQSQLLAKHYGQVGAHCHNLLKCWCRQQQLWQITPQGAEKFLTLRIRPWYVHLNRAVKLQLIFYYTRKKADIFPNKRLLNVGSFSVARFFFILMCHAVMASNNQCFYCSTVHSSQL